MLIFKVPVQKGHATNARIGKRSRKTISWSVLISWNFLKILS